MRKFCYYDVFGANITRDEAVSRMERGKTVIIEMETRYHFGGVLRVSSRQVSW